MTPRQRELARHALGLPNRYRRSYRNRFLTGGECEDWRAMEAAGHAESAKPDDNGRTWFWLTRAGAEAACNKGESLCPEDFPPEHLYVVDLRKEFGREPYITFWRPKNGGYCFPLSWAGRYSRADIDGGGSYYTNKGADYRTGAPGRYFVRFAVACADVEALAGDPDTFGRGRIDGNAGPVVRNTKAMRQKLRRLRYDPRLSATYDEAA